MLINPKRGFYKTTTAGDLTLIKGVMLTPSFTILFPLSARYYSITEIPQRYSFCLRFFLLHFWGIYFLLY